MANFEVDGKEYELKLNYKAIQYLNKTQEGGSYGLIGKAIQGDFETFPHIVHAGLFHTDEKIPLKKVEAEIEKLISEEKLSLEDIMRICDEVVTQSFFYRATVQKMIKQNPELGKALEQLRG